MKKIILVVLLITMSLASQAQIYVDKYGNIHDQRKTTTNTSTKKSAAISNNRSSSGFDKSKLSFGGNLSLQFGDYTVVGISPQVGYDFNKYFTAGAGIGYTYFKDKRYTPHWSSSYASFNLFGRFYPIEYIVIGIQPEISYSWEKIDNGGTYKYFVPSFLVGGGLRLGGMIAMIQYDVVQDDHSPYGKNLFYSVGYTFRF